MGLEYIHQQGILHRDIKPENLVFDKKGYLRITDLGIARIWKPDNSQDTSGTPGYMAPEGFKLNYFFSYVSLESWCGGRLLRNGYYNL